MIVFDGHVHIYDCYDLEKFFVGAFRNFSSVGAQLQSSSPICYYMLLAEAAGFYYFNQLRQRARDAGASPPASWRIEESGEAGSLYVFHDDFPSMRLVLAAGRQLITREKLELLALMTDQEFDDGMSLEKGVAEVTRAGGLAVCPWGAGKWLGSRGEVLSTYITNGGLDLYLGDSGGRPTLWPRPALFNRGDVAEKLVSGSDPLPLGADTGRVGQFGTYIECDSPKEQPVNFLRDQVKTPGIELKSYGSLCSPFMFFKNQVALRLR